jgi:hypothetical protein
MLARGVRLAGDDAKSRESRSPRMAACETVSKK